MTNLNIGEAETQHKQKLTVEAPKATPPRNYFVPNFGMDKEIIGVQESIQLAEDQMGTKLKEFTQPKPFPTGYVVPNFGQDKDIKDSLADTSAAESKLNHVWDVKALQLDNAE